MNPAKGVHESPPPILPAMVYGELRSYLRESGSTLSPSESGGRPPGARLSMEAIVPA